MMNYEMILDNIDSGAAVISARGEIKWRNNSIATMFTDFDENGPAILKDIITLCDAEHQSNALDSPGEHTRESLIRFDNKDFIHVLNVKRILPKTNSGDTILIIDDITEFELLKKDLHESISRFDEVADNAQVFIWEVDHEGKYVYASPAVENMLGYSPEEIVGKKHFYDFFAPHVLEDMKAAAFLAFEEKAPFQNFVAEYTGRNGEKIILSTSGTPVLAPDGRLIGYRGADIDITEKAIAHEELKSSHERYHSLFESAAEGIVLIELNRMEIDHCNNAFKEMFGFEAQVPPETRVDDFFHPHHWNKIANDFSLVGIETKLFFPDVICIRNNGEQFQANVSISVASIVDSDYLVCFFTDITGQKMMAQELELLGVAIDQSANMVMVTDKNGVITLVNKAFSRITGYSSEEAIGQKPSLLKSGRQTEHFYKTLWDTILSGQIWTGKLLNKRRDGRLYWENSTITPIIDKDGSILSFISIKEDINDLIKAESERESLISEMELKNKELETLSYGISHDMKAPLVTIEGYCAFLEEDCAEHMPDSCGKHIETIKMASTKLRNLIDEFMKYSKIGRMPLNPAKLKLAKVVDQAIRSIHPKSSLNNIKVEVKNGDFEFVGDLNRIAQVFENLITNSIKYMDPENDSPRIEIGREISETHRAFYVRDNGIGVARENLDKMFDMFFQEKKSAASEGSGVGLAVVKKIIELHGGKIWAESEPGGGTAVYFMI